MDDRHQHEGGDEHEPEKFQEPNTGNLEGEDFEKFQEPNTGNVEEPEFEKFQEPNTVP